LLVRRDLPPIKRLDGLAEDGDVGLFRFQMQGQLLVARPNIQLAEIRGQKRFIGKNEAEQGDVWTEDQGRIKR
jgi:hypothetical protein